MTSKTNSSNPTYEQICKLRDEANRFGDDAQVRMCGRALRGSKRALKGVAEALRFAAAENEARESAEQMGG